MVSGFRLQIFALALGGCLAEDSLCSLDSTCADEVTLLQGMLSRVGQHQPMSAEEEAEVSKEMQEAEEGIEDMSLVALSEAESQPASPGSWVFPANWNIQASSSWDSNYGAANVVAQGGRPWHSGRRNAFPEDLTFDAGEVITLDGFRTAQPPSGSRGSAMRAFTILKSNDGATFTEVLQGEGRNLAAGETQDIEFPAVSARYWRLNMRSNHGYHRLLTVQYIKFRLAAAAGCEGIYEAEDATIEGAVEHSNTRSAGHQGFTGRSFVDYVNSHGDFVEWTVSSCRRGSATASFRYALAGGNRPLQVLVNGQEVDEALSFPACGGGDWKTWCDVSVPVALSSGQNTIKLVARGQSGANMDSLAIAMDPGATEYVGCFVDDRARDLGQRVGANNNIATNTFDGCRTACGNHRYMSLQYGGECFCADSYGNGDQYVQVDDSECNRVSEPCSSNSHNCGGSWRQAIYEINQQTLVVFDNSDSALTVSPGTLSGVGQLGWQTSANSDYEVVAAAEICGISFKCNTAATHAMIGLAHAPVASYRDFDYAVTCRGAWQPFTDIYENGGNRHREGGRAGNGNPTTDVHAIRINEGGQVEYSLNDGVYYTSTRPVTYPWHAAVDSFTAPSLVDVQYLQC